MPTVTSVHGRIYDDNLFLLVAGDYHVAEKLGSLKSFTLPLGSGWFVYNQRHRESTYRWCSGDVAHQDVINNHKNERTLRINGLTLPCSQGQKRPPSYARWSQYDNFVTWTHSGVEGFGLKMPLFWKTIWCFMNHGQNCICDWAAVSLKGQRKKLGFTERKYYRNWAYKEWGGGR